MKHQREHNTDNSKKPYSSPELKVYGTISELTHSGAATVLDGGGGSQSAFDLLPPEK